MSVVKGGGLVNNVIKDEAMAKLKGNMGMGHTRYSTMGGTDLSNCQPFLVYYSQGLFAMAHNGELINSQAVRKTILQQGIGLTTNTDSELITQLLSRTPDENEDHGLNWPARIRHLMEHSATAYSLLIMHADRMYGVRDPFGNRPLCLGKIVLLSGDSGMQQDDNVEGWVIASESCSFQSIGAKYIRDVEPGEIVELTRNGIRSVDIISRPKKSPPAFCIFEYVYFARPDSIMEGTVAATRAISLFCQEASHIVGEIPANETKGPISVEFRHKLTEWPLSEVVSRPPVQCKEADEFQGQMVYKARYQCGMQLAKEALVPADIVSTIPESATPAALGFAYESGIPYVEVLCKNRYIGRTFIQPSRRLRQLSVAKKFGVLVDNCRGKRIILVDDSIVRGNTISPIIRMLMEAGALEVHIRIASPPIRHPCYMGINIPTKDELIANHKDVNQLARDTGATSLVYLTVEGLVAAIQHNIPKDGVREVGHCTACLTGKYPMTLDW